MNTSTFLESTTSDGLMSNQRTVKKVLNTHAYIVRNDKETNKV